MCETPNIWNRRLSLWSRQRRDSLEWCTSGLQSDARIVKGLYVRIFINPSCAVDCGAVRVKWTLVPENVPWKVFLAADRVRLRCWIYLNGGCFQRKLAELIRSDKNSGQILFGQFLHTVFKSCWVWKFWADLLYLVRVQCWFDVLFALSESRWCCGKNNASYFFFSVAWEGLACNRRQRILLKIPRAPAVKRVCSKKSQSCCNVGISRVTQRYSLLCFCWVVVDVIIFISIIIIWVWNMLPS